MTATDPVCRVEPVRPLPEAARRHPLAHRSGVELLARMVAAAQHWRPLTARQRTALRRAYQTALADAVRGGHAEVPLPALPDDVHPATLRALTRRGLAADGRLTPLAVEVVAVTLPLERGRQRRRGAIDTAQPRGDLMSTTPMIDPARLAEITRLAAGSHESPTAGMCLMEAVSYVRGIRHTDRPACVSSLLGDMGRSLNDRLPDDLRQELIPLIPDLPGTAGDGHDEQRSYLALDWLIRVYLPTWLELSPACRESAARVRELGRIVDRASAERAGPVVRAARTEAAAAGAAAGAAALDAAWAAAGAAALDAAGAAAGAAALDAAWAAAGAAALDAAWAAAGAAARDALQPTVVTLQRSAIDLYRRMTLAGRPTAGVSS